VIVSKELKKEIGNAFAAYGRILRSASLGCDLPSAFEKLKYESDENLRHRMTILRDFYNQLDEE
jgi:hypothetical protein